MCVCVFILVQAVRSSNTGRGRFVCPPLADRVVEPMTEDGIAEDCKLIKEQVGAIADCEAIVQNLWDKFETKEQALALSASMGLVKLVIMFEAVHIIVEGCTVEVCKLFMMQVGGIADCWAIVQILWSKFKA